MSSTFPQKIRRILRCALFGIVLVVFGFFTVVAISGCSAMFPEQRSLRDRLSVLPSIPVPLRAPVTIRWNDYQIPFIEAEHDSDLAFALGLVHTHLREGQMAFLRMLAAGRLSEMAGPFTTSIDHTLRILGPGRAVPEMKASLAPETREFLVSFVAGINFYLQHRPTEPPEYGLLGISPEAWSIDDVLLLTRLSGADVNWLIYYGLLQLRDHPDYPKIWERVRTLGETSYTSFASSEFGALSAVLSASRSGSNAIVVSGSRSASGKPLVANDPHLGLRLPNLWLIAGMKSPSFHAVGMMIPGLPFVGVGRSQCLAWGGTNMRAASSELYDVSNLPPESFTSEPVTIGRRLWPDAERIVRVSPFGPVLSDSPLFGNDAGSVLALRWMGHSASDEITAFHRAMRACTPAEFRAAFSSFAVSGQNMLFATAAGDIGQVLAVKLPRRSGFSDHDIVRDPDDTAVDWTTLDSSLSLPVALNPKEGFIVSANNRPVRIDSPVGFLFSADERVRRLEELLSGDDLVTIDRLGRIQRDVYSMHSHSLARFLSQEIVRHDLAATAPELVHALQQWDGAYVAASRGPVAFELLLTGFVQRLYQFSEDDVREQVFSQIGFLNAYLAEDYRALEPAKQQQVLQAALQEAGPAFVDVENWGAIHRLSVGHPLASLPLIGRFFVAADLPVDGSRETIMKSAHGLVRGRHNASYGSQSRHISDMADPDANFFVLLGGQDGWLGSDTFADQLSLWREGRYIQVPLTLERVRETFHAGVVTLRPE